MRTIIRNQLFMFLLRLIPTKIACWIGKRITNTSKKFGKNNILPKKYKDELRRFSIKKMENNAINAVLIGHYHQLGIEKINDKYLIYLGDWINHYTVTILHLNGEWEQKNWQTNK